MTSNDRTLSDRNLRQGDLVPPERLARIHAVVIGVGSVGRQVALQLAALGVPAMTLYDHDHVSIENLACQGFWETDIGDPKVHAVANVAHQQFPLMELHAIPERFRRSHGRGFRRDHEIAVFACVDAIDTRRLIWDAVQDRTRFFTDGRLAAEVIRVLASAAPHREFDYAGTLFRAGEAYAGSCTARTTIYAASIAAGLMLAQFARWLRGQPLTFDQTLNLLAAELSVAGSVT